MAVKKTKYFVISDIHGFYDETILALKSKGYNENNPYHKLLVLGDIFDRGSQSKEIYLWLKRLSDEKKCIILKGNHDNFLVKFLTDYRLLDNQFNYYNNGLDSTINSLLNNKFTLDQYYKRKSELGESVDSRIKAFKAWNSVVMNIINSGYSELISWIKSFPYYYETKRFIFTHSSIDTLAEDYKNPVNKSWDDLLWDDGSFYSKEINNTNKTVVVGHFSVADVRLMNGLDFERDYSILKRKDKKLIMIDGSVMLSGRVNVLVLED